MIERILLSLGRSVFLLICIGRINAMTVCVKFIRLVKYIIPNERVFFFTLFSVLWTYNSVIGVKDL